MSDEISIHLPDWLSVDDKLALIDAIELELGKLKESDAKDSVLEALEVHKVELTIMKVMQRSMIVLKPARMDFSTHQMR